MKKHLIAAAVAGAFAVPAMAQVTISGHIDFAGASVTGTQRPANGSTFSTTVGTSSTSVIRFIATEDLGGGMRATAQYNLDPRSLANDGFTVTNNGFDGTATTANSSLTNTATGVNRDEVFIGLSGGFGNVRLGSPNAIGLGSAGVSSPLGTGIGSGYTGGSSPGTMMNAVVQTRYSRSIRYDTPNINGFVASVLYAPGNDEARVAPTTTTSGSLTAFLIPNARTATEFGIAFSSGPITVNYAHVAQAAQTNNTGYYGSGSVASAAKTSVNLINANIKLGATTLYAGWNDGERLAASSGAAVATDGFRLAVKQDIGAIALMAQYTEQTGVQAVNVKSKVYGARVDYALSKRSAAYAGYESWDTGATYASGAALSTGTRKITSVGLRHSF